MNGFKYILFVFLLTSCVRLNNVRDTKTAVLFLVYRSMDPIKTTSPLQFWKTPSAFIEASRSFLSSKSLILLENFNEKYMVVNLGGESVQNYYIDTISYDRSDKTLMISLDKNIDSTRQLNDIGYPILIIKHPLKTLQIYTNNQLSYTTNINV